MLLEDSSYSASSEGPGDEAQQLQPQSPQLGAEGGLGLRAGSVPVGVVTGTGQAQQAPAAAQQRVQAVRVPSGTVDTV